MFMAVCRAALFNCLMESFIDPTIIWLGPDTGVAHKDKGKDFVFHQIMECRDTPSAGVPIKEKDYRSMVFR